MAKDSKKTVVEKIAEVVDDVLHPHAHQDDEKKEKKAPSKGASKMSEHPKFDKFKSGGPSK